MFAPPANRSRALFTITVRDHDLVDLGCGAYELEHRQRRGVIEATEREKARG